MPALMRVERKFWNCYVAVKKNVFNRYLKNHTPWTYSLGLTDRYIGCISFFIFRTHLMHSLFAKESITKFLIVFSKHKISEIYNRIL